MKQWRRKLALAHTPWATGRQPFSIGLAPLDLAGWIEPDHDFAADLALKARLLASERSVVFVEEPDSQAAQAEVLSLLEAHLPARFPHLYRTDGGVLQAAGGPEAGSGLPPLERAAMLVQEDLVLMRKAADGWRIAAACLCFPSSWSLREKFGQSMDGIHANVPGYSTMGPRIARIFDNLKAELPVWRLNWSVYPDGERHHPETKALPRNWFGKDGTVDPARIFIRVERQTLRLLPGSGTILFTIKVMADPFAAFAKHPEGAALALALRGQLLALDAGQLEYKGLTAHRDAVAEVLLRLGGE